MFVRFLIAFLLLSASSAPHAQTPARPPTAPSVALFYGVAPPLEELAAFDAVVLEPDHAPQPLPAARHTTWFAYVSLGEVQPSRPYFRDIPAAWKLGVNPAFGSAVIDQSQEAWVEFFCERIARPLWQRGFRGFFLDTLDSYHLVAKTAAERARQEAGLAAVIQRLKQKFPEAKLMFNRGFEILPKVHDQAWAVAAESLYRGYDHATGKYTAVPQADRDWLAGQMRRVRDEYHLPALFIDYVEAKDRELARATARRIAADGFVPWVSTPALDILGIGALEVMPRKVLMLYQSLRTGEQLIYKDIHRVDTMPLNYLGYTAEYVDINKGLPGYPLGGRYAGIVTHFTDPAADEKALYAWLRGQIAAGMHVAVLGDFGFRMTSERASGLGLVLGPPKAALEPLAVAQRDLLMGFEIEPYPDRRTYLPLTLPLGIPGATPLLTLTGRAGERMDAVALTPWGGYALYPYNVIALPGAASKRWVIDPFAFFTRALGLPDMPVPDTTTETGRRLLLVHIDGDGFASRSETRDARFSGEVLLTDILARYHIPHTISIIEGETSAKGVYPELAPKLEPIARRIFARDDVEIASHSFSHPFRWREAEASAQGSAEKTPVSASETYSLKIPNYTYSTRTEVQGSIDYINTRLAPPGKRVRVFLWTGDCDPDEAPLRATDAAGVYNMNGGDTLITRADPSLTLVSPLGIPRGDHFQVYAPNQNENVYTRLWEGPYYGFERVVETFELTESPRRLKPVDIYYHMYSTTKTASLAALHKVYDWALARPMHPVYASEYIARVLDFGGMVVARALDGSWRIRGANALRTLRMPAAAGFPSGAGIAGYAPHGKSIYIHLSSDEAHLRMLGDRPAGPVLRDANARVTAFEASADGIRFGLSGDVPLEFRLQGAERCVVSASGRALKPDRSGQYALTSHAADDISVRCR